MPEITYTKDGHKVIRVIPHDKTEVPNEIIDDILRYCENQAIYDKLGNYGDFYYKLKQIRKK